MPQSSNRGTRCGPWRHTCVGSPAATTHAIAGGVFAVSFWGCTVILETWVIRGATVLSANTFRTVGSAANTRIAVAMSAGARYNPLCPGFGAFSVAAVHGGAVCFGTGGHATGF